MRTEHRKKRSIRIRVDLCQWVEEQVKKGKFQKFSHVIDAALEKLIESQRKERKRSSNQNKIRSHEESA